MKFRLNIDYIKFTELKCGNTTIKCDVRSINNEKIFLCSKYNVDYLKIASQDVVAKFVCIDGLYTIKTKLELVKRDEPYVIFTLKTPLEMNFEQKRNFFRIETSQSCICETELDGVISQYSGIIVNLSANGVCALFPNYFLTNGECSFKFKLDGKDFILKSKYIRSENYNNNYKVSFTFTEIADEEKDFISKTCFQKQLENRRKNMF